MCKFSSSLQQRSLLVLAIVCSLVGASPTFAQGKIELRLEPLVRPVRDDDPFDDDDDDNEEIFAGVFRGMTRESIRESLFANWGGSESAFQKTKRESIQRELDRIEQICGLTELQKRKIDDAIEVDIQHLHTKIETLLSDFDSKMTLEQFQTIQQNINSFANEVISRSSDSKEVWRKVLRSQLTGEQSELLEKDKVLVATNQLRTKRMHILLQFQRKLGLNEKQRTVVLDWIGRQDNLEVPFGTWCERLLAAKEEASSLTDRQRAVLAEVPVNRVDDNKPARIQINNLLQLPRKR